MGKVPYKLGIRELTATCSTCTKSWRTPNAQGVGARHALAWGHQVRVEVHQVIIYGSQELLPFAEFVHQNGLVES